MGCLAKPGVFWQVLHSEGGGLFPLSLLFWLALL